MRRYFLLASLVLFGLAAKSQRVPLAEISRKLKSGQVITAGDLGFKEYWVKQKGDTVRFYTFQKSEIKPTSVYLFLPGSAAQPVYSWHKESSGSFWFNSLTDFDFSYLPDEYLLVIVAKPGFGIVGNGDDKTIPQSYWDHTSLDDRVKRAETALKYVKKHIISRPEREVVFGYSEGFYVAAKLATLHRGITHLGIGGGGAYSDFYDFIVSNWRAVCSGEWNTDSATQYSQQVLDDARIIMAQPGSTQLMNGYTYKRWSSFSEPAIHSLVKLTIPLFQVHGGKDESTPIESAYGVPVEFIRRGKKNLTFKVYPECDHSLREFTADQKEISRWNEMMRYFFEWVRENEVRR